MLDQIKAMSALANLLKNRERLREQFQRVRERLQDMRLDGQAQGGAVRATASGRLRIATIEIGPGVAQALAKGDANSRTYAQALIVEAVNHALEKAEEAAKAEVGKAAQEAGLGDIPGLQNVLSGL